MVGWHHRLDGHEFKEAPGVDDGQGSLACCSPWGCRESDTTEQQNFSCAGSFLAEGSEGFSSCSSPGSGAWAQLHVGSSPEPGIELMSPALAGGFFTTEPPGKPPTT